MTLKNILFLIANNQRFDTIHALGNQEIQTTNIEKLIERGLSFEEAFIRGGTSGAVCMPSHAMILPIDQHSGTILDALPLEGTLDETLIIFTGDNGLSIGQYQGRFGISSWERLLGSFCPNRRGVAS